MPPLDRQQWQRLHIGLCRKLRLAERSDLLAIGFGAALRRQRIDPQRRFAVCFLVADKRSARRPLPRTVSCGLRVNQQLVRWHWPTDVIACRGALTGIDARIRRAKATASAVVRWKHGGNVETRWGILMNGHLFPADRIPLGQKVRLDGPGGPLTGQLVVRSGKRERVDAAVVQVARFDLIARGLLPAGFRGRPLRVDHASQWLDRIPGPAWMRPRQTKLGFQLHAYFPRLAAIPGVGNLQDVLLARQAKRRTFAQGTSGTVWNLPPRQPIALQFAGTPPDFSVGFGQSLAVCLEWADRRLTQTGARPHSLQLMWQF